MKNLKLIFTYTCVSVCFASSNNLIGQKGPEITMDYEIYNNVDTAALFIYGIDSLNDHVRRNFKMPQAGSNGIFLIQFVVEKNGTISDLRAIAPKD